MEREMTIYIPGRGTIGIHSTTDLRVAISIATQDLVTTNAVSTAGGSGSHAQLLAIERHAVNLAINANSPVVVLA
jgi:hypothetical protein